MDTAREVKANAKKVAADIKAATRAERKVILASKEAKVIASMLCKGLLTYNMKKCRRWRLRKKFMKLLLHLLPFPMLVFSEVRYNHHKERAIMKLFKYQL